MNSPLIGPSALGEDTDVRLMDANSSCVAHCTLYHSDIPFQFALLGCHSLEVPTFGFPAKNELSNARRRTKCLVFRVMPTDIS